MNRKYITFSMAWEVHMLAAQLHVCRTILSSGDNSLMECSATGVGYILFSLYSLLSVFWILLTDVSDHSWMPHLLSSFGLLLVATSVLGWFWIQSSCARLISLAKTLPMVDPPVPLLGHLLSAIVNPKTKGLRFFFLSDFILFKLMS